MFQVKHFSEFEPMLETYPVSKKKKKVNYTQECDTIFCFDIEVASAWKYKNKLIPYHTGETDDFWNELETYALPYIWQFSQNDVVYYGRELQDFLQVLKKFPIDTHIIIYIHNASYEFMFLNNILRPWENVFARSPHKPMKFISSLFPNIEFRCSYNLTRMSLDVWGKTLGFEKLHTLDYVKIRTPNTKLEQKELDYAERDCLVMYKGLLKYRERYGHVEQIPLTQTGEVRRVVKKKMRTNPRTGKSDSRLINSIIRMLPKDAKEYARLKSAFQGGYCHANFLLSGYVHRGTIYAWDFASSYPFCMCACKFPMSAFFEMIYDESEIETYAYLLKIRFENVQAKTYNHYLSKSKCFEIKNGRFDNGRIISCDSCETWFTELDFEIMKKTYNFKYEIIESYASHKGYLPKQFIEYILELYGNKTTLKKAPTGTTETEEEEKQRNELYSISKQFINSMYGMCVTDLINDDIETDGIEWTTKEKTLEELDDFLKELHNNNRGRTFLSFSWGVWCTAWARFNIWQCITHENVVSLAKQKTIRKNDENVIYVDTDSLKMRTLENFDWYNEQAENKLKAMCEHYNIDFEKTRPKDQVGIPRQLGRLEREPDASEFITLGAKRYCYRTADDGILHITVAGINKEAVSCLNDNIENFTDELCFDKDHDGVNKLFHVYIDDMKEIIWNKGEYDEYISKLKYGISMRPTGYTMGIIDEYEMLLLADSVVRLNCIDEIIKQGV